MATPTGTKKAVALIVALAGVLLLVVIQAEQRAQRAEEAEELAQRAEEFAEEQRARRKAIAPPPVALTEAAREAAERLDNARATGRKTWTAKVVPGATRRPDKTEAPWLSPTSVGASTYCRDPWNGSNPALVRDVKSRLREPSSFKHIRTYRSGSTFTMTYRARNGFGGMSHATASARVACRD